MIFKQLRSIFKSKNPTTVTSISTEVLGESTISFWTAGVKFDNRLENVLKCQLKEPLTLLREPDNEIDTNAIHIKTLNNLSLGYVGKFRAVKLAPLLDNNQLDKIAYLTELKCDLANKIYGVKITIPVSKDILHSFKSDQTKEIDFEFDISSRENLYLLVDCEDAILDEISNAIKKLNIKIHRAGLSYTPSSNGKQFKWYLRLDNDADKNNIELALRHKYPLLEEKYNERINAEYLELQDENLSELESENQTLSKELHTLKFNLGNFKKRERLYAHQFESMLSIFLANVTFISDSIDILKNEIKDYTTALSKITEIYNTVNFKAKKIQTLNKWFEIHYNTGQKDDGRIYFKKENHQMQVLVSFKSGQKKDIEYLKKVAN